MSKAIDTMCLHFVLFADRMGLNKQDVQKSHNVLQVTSPIFVGGLGLHQMVWSHKARFVTLMQNTLCMRPVLLAKAVPLRNYLSILM